MDTNQFDPLDVVTINIGINDTDIRRNNYTTTTPADKPAKDGASTAVDAAVQVKRLIDKGAKTIIFTTFGSVNFVSQYFEAKNMLLANEFAGAYYAGLQNELPPLAESGARILLVDIDAFYTQLKFDLPKGELKHYGPPVDSGFPRGAAQAWQLQYVLHDKLHPSTGGFKALAKYMADFLEDPSKIEPSNTLMVNSESLKGDIFNNGKVIFYVAKDKELPGIIRGLGSVRTVGPGKPSWRAMSVELTGNRHSVKPNFSKRKGDELHLQ